MVSRLEQKWMEWQSRSLTRRMRRLLVLGVAFILIVQLLSAAFSLWRPDFSHTGRLYGSAAAVTGLSVLVLTWLWTRTLRRITLSSSFEERAQMDFGKHYLDLPPRHRFDVRVRVRREVQAGGRPADERDERLQRDAERKAYRWLRATLPVAVFLFWAVCLSLPPGGVRAGLLMGALVLSGMVAPILVLPQMIQMWTEPNATREPELIEREAEA